MTGDYTTAAIDPVARANTADETITVSRGYDGAQFPAWIQGIDFSALSE